MTPPDEPQQPARPQQQAPPQQQTPPRGAAEPAKRVVVTSPRTSAARHPPGRHALRALDEQDVVGELLVRSLVRAQLFLALRMLTVLGVLLGGLPLLFALVPGTSEVQLLGLPLPWLVLGVLVHPALVVGGVVYLRLSERNERDFADVVERS